MVHFFDMQELPDKTGVLYPSPYAIKLKSETKERIDIINGYKDGLTGQIREAIELVVNGQWEILQRKLRAINQEDKSA